MTVSVYPTELSTDPWRVEVGSTEKRSFAIDFAAILAEVAGDTLTSGRATVRRLGPMTTIGFRSTTGTPAGTGIVTAISKTANAVIPTLTGFTRGDLLEMSVEITTSTGRIRERVLVIAVVS